MSITDVQKKSLISILIYVIFFSISLSSFAAKVNCSLNTTQILLDYNGYFLQLENFAIKRDSVEFSRTALALYKELGAQNIEILNLSLSIHFGLKNSLKSSPNLSSKILNIGGGAHSAILNSILNSADDKNLVTFEKSLLYLSLFQEQKFMLNWLATDPYNFTVNNLPLEDFLPSTFALFKNLNPDIPEREFSDLISSAYLAAEIILRHIFYAHHSLYMGVDIQSITKNITGKKYIVKTFQGGEIHSSEHEKLIFSIGLGQLDRPTQNQDSFYLKQESYDWNDPHKFTFSVWEALTTPSENDQKNNSIQQKLKLILNSKPDPSDINILIAGGGNSGILLAEEIIKFIESNDLGSKKFKITISGIKINLNQNLGNQKIHFLALMQGGKRYDKTADKIFDSMDPYRNNSSPYQFFLKNAKTKNIAVNQSITLEDSTNYSNVDLFLHAIGFEKNSGIELMEKYFGSSQSPFAITPVNEAGELIGWKIADEEIYFTIPSMRDMANPHNVGIFYTGPKTKKLAMEILNK